jgi:hypothetical protein
MLFASLKRLENHKINSKQVEQIEMS